MSPFTDISPTEWVASNRHAFAIRDPSPVSPGHTLIVTRRAAVRDWFEATDDERRAILELIEEVKADLDRADPRPDGFNVGFDVGAAAGQTVLHLHVHVIPRFLGDVEDPGGGIRQVIPSAGNLLHHARRAEPISHDRTIARVRARSPLATGGEHDPLAHQVLPLFAIADEIAIVAAFVQTSGLDRIQPVLEPALRRGATVRILTGDYLEITQVGALERLLDLQRSGGIEDDEDLELEPRAQPSRLAVRVVEVERLPARTRSFHPKSWRFQSNDFGLAFVGSSNLSRSALDTGIEWNLRVDRARDAATYARIAAAFEEIWNTATELSEELVASYAARARARPELTVAAGEVEPEVLAPLPEPHEVQTEALAALREAREVGRKRALVVLATGLGKTILAVHDYRQLKEEQGRRPRLLFLAHRRELLRQAAKAYRRLLRELDPEATVGWYSDAGADLSATLVFASVAKLAREPHLDRLRSEHFDYVVVDEVHHAAADSYRRILDALHPGFLLGLTATPDRADAADIGGLFDDFVAYRADLGRGIELGRLVPFHYFGVKDSIDYTNLPWRNGRFAPEALTRAAETEARMATLWSAWGEHHGAKTLVFCCSVTHASYVRAWLAARGVRAAAVFAAEGSDDRDEALRQLEHGELDALCAVDVFNEGIDVPAIDRVVMLRPTESSVVFLQQLGRGLRASAGKDAVTVIDFVGNHRVFVQRLRALLSLQLGRSVELLERLIREGALTDLPDGCRVELELEAKELLAGLFRVGGADEVERAYRTLRLERGVRPKAGELQRMGYLPSRLRDRHGTWLDFVRGEGDLLPAELAVADAAGEFLGELERLDMAKSFELVALEILLERGTFFEGMELGALAREAHDHLMRSPELEGDVPEELRGALGEPAQRVWLKRWLEGPIDAWTRRRPGRRTWFTREGGIFRPVIGRSGLDEATFTALARELVDYRLAQYRARRRQANGTSEGFVCRVTWNQRDPILKLPNRGSTAVPSGETDVRVEGGVWVFRFAKEFCNVARPVGTQANRLGDLMRRWFGPSAGQPGTSFEVRFVSTPGGLHLEPVSAKIVDLGSRRSFIAYPDLQAAAGAAVTEHEALERERVLLPTPVGRGHAADGRFDREHFAVRVSGDSMDGGKMPLRDGDWAVLRLARSFGAAQVEGHIVLLELPGEGGGARYQLKRLERSGSGWRIVSQNPTYPSVDFSAETSPTPIARLEAVVRPEELAPTRGEVIESHELAVRFGLEVLPATTGRHHGHLFLFLEARGSLSAYDQAYVPGDKPRPGETAFVLAKHREAWKYLGVGRQAGVENRWTIPEVDFATLRALGEGREASRRLPEGAEARALQLVTALLSPGEGERWLERSNGRRARIIGPSKQGGLRIDGGPGPGAFAERTVSRVDLAWAIVTADSVAKNGGLLDEAHLNRLRYLEGTPKSATRYIDSGWALAALRTCSPDRS